MTQIEIYKALVQKQDEIINWFDDGKTEGDAVIRKKIAELWQQLEECEVQDKSKPYGWTCPRCGKVHSWLSMEGENNCNNCKWGICLTKDWPCADCNGSNKWEPIK